MVNLIIRFTLLLSLLNITPGCKQDTPDKTAKKETPKAKSPKAEKEYVVSEKSQKVIDENTTLTPRDPNAPDFVPSDLPLPDACSLITTLDVQEVFGVDATGVSLKNATNRQSPHSASCFYKWDGKRPNAGIFIQIQKNPVGAEYPQWATAYVESKRSVGESAFSTDGKTYKYKKWDFVGDDGSYSYDMAKYVWRIGNDYVYTIAFNEDMTESEMTTAAQKLATKVMSSLKK